MAGKGARGRARAPIGCARVHANDASVGLFRVYNSSCVTVCMIVSLVSLILSHSSSSARDWNRFQAVLDEPATGLGASAVWSAPTAGRRYPTLTNAVPPPSRHEISTATAQAHVGTGFARRTARGALTYRAPCRVIGVGSPPPTSVVNAPGAFVTSFSEV